MRHTFALMIFIVLCAAATPAHGQRDTIAPPVGGVYQAYYEDEFPERLPFFLHFKNICFERFATLNPQLNYEYIPYGTPILLPKNERCYDYQEGEFYGTWGRGHPARLKYYENGTWLEQPYYSADVTYRGGANVEDIADKLNICVEDLLQDNYILANYPIRFAGALSLDIFIPPNAQPCDPTRLSIDNYAMADGMKQLEIPPYQAYPLYLVLEYNLCREELSPYEGLNIYAPYNLAASSVVRLLVPEYALPCYNEQGQRLIYVNEMGLPLEAPVYSDLEVYLAPPHTTLEQITEKFGVCLFDLLRVNQFPELPALVDIEIFIPPARICDDPLNYQQMTPSPPPYNNVPRNLNEISVRYNICPEELEGWNPHLIPNQNDHIAKRPYQRDYYNSVWAFIPTNAEPCYEIYKPPLGTTIYDIEHILNICYENFIWQGPIPYLKVESERTSLYYRRDSMPCYNSNGSRLEFKRDIQPYYQWGYFSYTNNTFPTLQNSIADYSGMPIEPFPAGGYLIDLSRKFNVCIEDLLKANPRLIRERPAGHPTFLPQTRPCYDEASGLQLIYEDIEGNPLSEPQLSEHLVYYGIRTLSSLSYLYNVCINRIEDANRAKMNKETSYLGWIIPTDRPPCYDANGQLINYVCYDQPIDSAIDYRHTNLTFTYDGTHCYDLAAPETVIWYRGKGYQARAYQKDDPYAPDRFSRIWEGWLINSPAFSAWCFGVPESEIIEANATPALIDILPYQHRAIPKPTRACYIDHPEWFEGKIVHIVESGDTLSALGQQYDVPYPLIVWANGLDLKNPLWIGQKLIIPTGISTAQFYALILGGGVLFLLTVGLILPLIRQRRGS